MTHEELCTPRLFMTMLIVEVECSRSARTDTYPVSDGFALRQISFIFSTGTVLAMAGINLPWA